MYSWRTCVIRIAAMVWTRAKKTAWWNWLKANHAAVYNAAMKERIERECAARIAKLNGGN